MPSEGASERRSCSLAITLSSSPLVAVPRGFSVSLLPELTLVMLPCKFLTLPLYMWFNDPVCNVDVE